MDHFVSRFMPARTPDLSASAYYQHSGRVPLASRLSLHVRTRMFRVFMDQMRPGPETRVLDVGVTSDQDHAESNYFERMYPYPQNITCVGTEDGTHLQRSYAGLKYTRVKPHEPLPFADGAFDIVFSNAVIEHVGSRADQAAFARELCRVGRAFFVTTPDRWFPIEHHTGVPLLHYLPARAHRAVLQRTRYRYWSEEANLNILTAGAFAQLFPRDVNVQVRIIRWLGLPANMIAFGTRAR
jgi:SAM-dependent methyltransferase